MTEHTTFPDGLTSEEQELPPASSVMTPPVKRRTWTRGAIPAVGLILGLVIGLAIGVPAGHSDPTTSAQYRALQQRLGTSQTEAAKLQTDMGDIEASAQAAQESAQAAQAAASASQAANAEQAAAIASQQAALSAAQQQIAANSIGEGTWTVGSNVAPGSYRTSAAVSGQCYWEITKSGTNGDVIIQNDIVSGGFPTVRLSVGQDFKNEGCGTFVKQ